jgi:hypothetical protein
MSTVFPYLPRGKWSSPEAPQPRADLIPPMVETPGTGPNPGSLDAAGTSGADPQTGSACATPSPEPALLRGSH